MTVTNEARPAPTSTDLDVLMITTASNELSDTQLAEFPGSGKVFVARVPVQGEAVSPWIPFHHNI